MRTILPLLITISCSLTANFLIAQCPNNSLNLSFQFQVDDFSTNYPNCTNFLYDLSISGTDITNLDGLSGLQQINFLNINNADALEDISGLQNIHTIGALDIRDNDILSNVDGLSSLVSCDYLIINQNASLLNIQGLNQLTNIMNLDISSNNLLNNLDGLQGLTSVQDAFYLSSNANLKSLKGLENLNYVGSGLSSPDPYFTIGFNNSLTDLTALQNLSYVDGSFNIQSNGSIINLYGLENFIFTRILSIQNNASLLTLSGLDNLGNVEDFISIYLNPKLVSLDALSNISNVPNEGVSISSNASLSFCAVDVVCSAISQGGIFGANISGNAPGCATVTEVDLECQNFCLNLPVALVLNTSPIPNELHQAKSSISSNALAPSGIGIHAIIYKAGDIISLENNFEINLNTNFEATIHDSGCP